MAQESCNLDKEEAEILKPSSSSPPSTPPPPPPPPPQSSSSPTSLKPAQLFPVQRPERLETPAIDAPKKQEEPRLPARFVSRCSSCQKRVGLSGFRCRCGDLFCARHRYSDTHDCSFDYKAAGREEIARANPVVKAAKIIKI